MTLYYGTQDWSACEEKIVCRAPRNYNTYIIFSVMVLDRHGLSKYVSLKPDWGQKKVGDCCNVLKIYVWYINDIVDSNHRCLSTSAFTFSCMNNLAK